MGVGGNEPIPIDSIPNITKYSYRICKIKLGNSFNGYGFLCKIPFPQKLKLLPVLITNSSLSEYNFSEIKTLKIYLGENGNCKELTYSKERKIYKNEKFNVCFLEIYPDKDDINDFFEFKEKIQKNDKIYIFQHNDQNKYTVSEGEIDKIKEFEIKHDCKIQYSDFPIISTDDYKVIGITKRKDGDNLKYGTILKHPIEEFNKNIEEKIIEQTKKYICKLKIKEFNGMGFLCKIPFPNEFTSIPVLITSYQLLEKYGSSENIEIKINLNEKLKINLTVSSDRKFYQDKNDNIAIIEIFPKNDNLHDFLDTSIQTAIKEDDIIYVLRNKNTFLYGIIKNVDNNEVKHNCKIEKGNEGAPIISLNNFKVIGMILEKNNSKTGVLLKNHIEKFYEKNNNEKDYKPEANFNGRAINNTETKKILQQMEKNICKIYDNNNKTGTGFFCKIPKNGDECDLMRVLITNNHVLDENDISINKTIEFSINNDNEKKKIVITPQRKTYTNKKFDITIIEINKGELNPDNFLEYNTEKIEDNSQVYVLQYPKGGEASYSTGLLKRINKSEIIHKCDTDEGSSGGPILLLKNFKVFGVHKGKKSNINANCGTLLEYPINEFCKKFIKSNDNNMNYNNMNYNDMINNNMNNSYNNLYNNNHFRNSYNGNNNIIANLNNSANNEFNNIQENIESPIKNAKTFNFEKKIKIILRESGINRKKAFVIECLLSDKVKDVIDKYKHKDRVKVDNVLKYKCNNKEITQMEKTIKELGLKNNSTIFAIYN